MESCKIPDTTQITDDMKVYVEGLVKCTSDFAKEQVRLKMPDISKEGIKDLYEGFICRAICSKSKAEYEKFRAEGLSQVDSAKMALLDRLISLRDRGELPDDVAMENVIRDVKNGTIGYSTKGFSRNLHLAYGKFKRAAGEKDGYTKDFRYSCHDPKSAEYYLDIIAKFNTNMSSFVREAMDFYIDNHQQELEEIERREDGKNKEEANEKEKVSEKNSRLFG